MRTGLIFSSGLIVLGAQMAQAGAIERTTQSVAILFEEGRYAEVSFGYSSPDVSGRVPGTPYDTGGSVLADFWQFGFGVKMPVTPEFDLALVVDQPIGADVDYPAAAVYPIAGTTATVDSTAVTLMGRYRLPSNVSLVAGVRALTTSGEVSLPVMIAPGTVAPYTMDTTTETDWGYLAGVAYERPEIGLRVSLIYNSAIDHRFDAQEVAMNALGQVLDYDTSFTSTIPQSLNLEAQTGIAEDTLLFGSIRWVDWSEFDIDPVAYRTANISNPEGEKLVGYEKDYTTYTLGLGRRFNEAWAGAASVSYENSTNRLASNLGPVNGYTSLNLGLSYTRGPLVVSGLVRYFALSQTDTQRIGADFDSNDTWASGLRIGYRF